MNYIEAKEKINKQRNELALTKAEVEGNRSAIAEMLEMVIPIFEDQLDIVEGILDQTKDKRDDG